MAIIIEDELIHEDQKFQDIRATMRGSYNLTKKRQGYFVATTDVYYWSPSQGVFWTYPLSLDNIVEENLGNIFNLLYTKLKGFYESTVDI